MGISFEVDVDIDAKHLFEVVNRLPQAENMIVDEGSKRVLRSARNTVVVLTVFLKSTLGRVVEGSRAIVQALAPYALWVEVGTRKMDGQPYLRPALMRVNWAAIISGVFKRIGL